MQRNMTVIKQYLNFIFGNSLNFIICIAWGAILLGYWRGINNHIPVLRNYTDEIEWMIVVVPLVLSLRSWSKILKIRDVLFVLCCIFFYVLNFLIFPENEPYLSARFFSFSILVLPYFFVGVALDLKKYLNVFYFISVLSIGICAFYQLIYAQSSSYTGEASVSDYNMSLAYGILPHVLMSSWIALRDLKIWKILVMLLGVFLLLALGTRGPVLCSVLFIVVYVLLFKPSKHKAFKNIIVISVGVYILRFLNQFMFLMQGVVMQAGLSTRIFDKYFEGELETSEGREFITSKLLEELKTENPLCGFGILGSYNYVDNYPHNIFVDFVFSFGWLVGTILLMSILILIIWALRYVKSQDDRVFLIILICAGIVHLCMSGTYLDSTMFFMLLGFCIRSIRRKNYQC